MPQKQLRHSLGGRNPEIIKHLKARNDEGFRGSSIVIVKKKDLTPVPLHYCVSEYLLQQSHLRCTRAREKSPLRSGSGLPKPKVKSTRFSLFLC
jgi:hypothetical protein